MTLAGEPPLSGIRQLVYNIQSLTLFLSVNGGSPVTIDQPNTGGGHVVLSVPVKLNLRSGSNTISFSANQSSRHSFTCVKRKFDLTRNFSIRWRFGQDYRLYCHLSSS